VSRAGIAIVNCLDEHRQFTSEPIAVDYDAESRDDRVERRRQRWTPVTMALTPIACLQRPPCHHGDKLAAIHPRRSAHR